MANAFGLDGSSFALDAACSSSLYAMEIACRMLQRREADLMLAGGIARADPLFIHLGFTALQALSPSGQSRPFHKGADGLLPAEGAGLVALKRLDDAVRDGDHVFGVIRGIGLSNDGRQSGFLAPAVDGQVRAMRQAYAQAGLTPADVDLVECHATGTPKGDTVEIESMAHVWGDAAKPVIGSLKANLGHPITASGVASLFKVLSSFEAGILPPTPCDDPLESIDEHGFRLLRESEPWTSDGPRRGAISNFGFGGNNAHLIVEEWTGAAPKASPVSERASSPEKREDVAICAMGILTGETVGLSDFVRRLAEPQGGGGTRTEEITLSLDDLGFPPLDLQESLAQQTSILVVVEEALRQLGPLDPERTGVYVGMCVDPQAARHGLRVRLPELMGSQVPMDRFHEANAEAAPDLTAAGVIGCMPNIPANRVHAQRDWTAPGFTVASEELSGLDALELAVRALQDGDIDAALVGASDFSHEAAHMAAAAQALPEDRQRPGDAAVALVLMRASDAHERGAQVLATVALSQGHRAPVTDAEEDDTVSVPLVPEVGESEVTARFGHAHGASGLLHLAAGAITAHLGVTLDEAGAWPAPRHPDAIHTRVRTRSFSGRERSVWLKAPARPDADVGATPAPLCRFYAAATQAALGESVAADQECFEGNARVALVANDEASLAALREHAAAELGQGRVPAGPG
ncbi:MAG: beta-ketoacyl synthase N-terminal-like domain-containing protein, partial [Planctomycetota bacterium]